MSAPLSSIPPRILTSPSPFIEKAQTKASLTQLFASAVESHQKNISMCEVESYKECVVEHIPSLTEIIFHNQKFPSFNTREGPLQIVKRNNNYSITIFDKSVRSTPQSGSIKQGSSKIIKQNCYTVDLNLQLQQVVIKHWVSLAGSSPVFRKYNGICRLLASKSMLDYSLNEFDCTVNRKDMEMRRLQEELGKENFIFLEKYSKKSAKERRIIFMAEYKGRNLYEVFSYDKHDVNMKNTIRKEYVFHAIKQIKKNEYKFYDNKAENTLLKLSPNGSFELTWIDYQQPNYTNYTVRYFIDFNKKREELQQFCKENAGDPDACEKACQEFKKLRDDFLFKPQYHYYRFVEVFMTYFSLTSESFRKNNYFEEFKLPMQKLKELYETVKHHPKEFNLQEIDIQNLEKAFFVVQQWADSLPKLPIVSMEE